MLVFIMSCIRNTLHVTGRNYDSTIGQVSKELNKLFLHLHFDYLRNKTPNIRLKCSTHAVIIQIKIGREGNGFISILAIECNGRLDCFGIRH